MSTALPPQAKVGLNINVPVFKEKLSHIRPDLAALIDSSDDVTELMVALVVGRHAGVR